MHLYSCMYLISRKYVFHKENNFLNKIHSMERVLLKSIEVNSFQRI